MKKVLSLFIANIAVLLLTSIVTAQSSTPFTLPWFTITNGGGRSTGGIYMLFDTLNQSIVGRMDGGSFSLIDGFVGEPTRTGTVTPSPTPSATPTVATKEPAGSVTPTPSSTPSATPKTTATETGAPEITSTATRIQVVSITPTPTSTSDSDRAIYLAYFAGQADATPSPTKTPEWRQWGAAGRKISALALVNDHLLMADTDAATKGIYRASLAGCNATPDFRPTFVPVWAQEPVWSLAVVGNDVLAGTEGKQVLYSPDGGRTWQATQSDIEDRVRAVAIFDGKFYAGAEGDAATSGVFKSNDFGDTWTPIPDGPTSIANMQVLGDSLWIGTIGQCVWQLNPETDATIQFCEGLGASDHAAWRVWDIALDESATDPFYYIATASGIFSRENASSWESIEMVNGPMRTLEVTDGVLYAGGEQGNVITKPLGPNGEWKTIGPATGKVVRDLVFDQSNCGALIAATDDGVWIRR